MEINGTPQINYNYDSNAAYQKLLSGTVTNIQTQTYNSDQLNLSSSQNNNVFQKNSLTPINIYDNDLNSILNDMRTSQTSFIQNLYINSLDLIWPVDSSRITSDFGNREHPVYGGTRFHDGIDIGASSGSNIYASASGVVKLSGTNGGYGNCVILDHGNGISTVYGHASKLYVKSGQYVNKGDVIAAVGSTGVSTGPHLHFEIRQNNEQIDPLDFISI